MLVPFKPHMWLRVTDDIDPHNGAMVSKIYMIS